METTHDQMSALQVWHRDHDRELELEFVIRVYNAAARRFIGKCEKGEARSVETQDDLRKCLAMATKVLPES